MCKISGFSPDAVEYLLFWNITDLPLKVKSISCPETSVNTTNICCVTSKSREGLSAFSLCEKHMAVEYIRTLNKNLKVKWNILSEL